MGTPYSPRRLLRYEEVASLGRVQLQRDSSERGAHQLCFGAAVRQRGRPTALRCPPSKDVWNNRESMFLAGSLPHGHSPSLYDVHLNAVVYLYVHLGSL